MLLTKTTNELNYIICSYDKAVFLGVSMEKDVRRQTLSDRVLRHMEKNGYFNDYGIPKESVISLIEKVLKDHTLLRWGLSKIPKNKRQLLVLPEEMNNIEMYFFSRYLNAKGSLSVDAVIAEAEGLYGVHGNKSLRALAIKMRNRAHVAKTRILKKEASKNN